MSDPTPVSWRALRPDIPVFASDGTQVGTLERVAADDRSDILHGLVIRLSGRPEPVLVPRDAVGTLAADRITVALTADGAAALEPYEEAGASEAPRGQREA